MKRTTKIKILKWIGYPIFGLLCFLFALLFTFPFDALKSTVTEQAKEKAQVKLTMDSLAPKFPFGIHATGVVIDNLEGAPPSLFLPIPIPEITAKIGLFSLLIGNLDIGLSAKAFGGELEGDFQINQTQNRYGVELEAENLLFQELPHIKKSDNELPVRGVLSITADMSLDFEQPKKSEGFLEVHSMNGTVGPGKLKVEIPQVRTGDLVMRLELDNGRLVIKRFDQTSPDMDSDLIGSITLSKSLQSSRANLDYRFKLSEALLKKHDIFELALSAIRNSQGSDGYYYQTFRGPLMNLKPRPNKAAQYKFEAKKKSKGKKPADKKMKKPPQRKPKKRPPPKVKKREEKKPEDKAEEEKNRPKSLQEIKAERLRKMRERQRKSKVRDRIKERKRKLLQRNNEPDEPVEEELEEYEYIEDELIEEDELLDDAALDEEDPDLQNNEDTQDDNGADEDTEPEEEL